jgi:hypothetical protein
MAGYIGNIPTPQATQSRQSFTATASQTTFATVGYTPNFLDVYLNGVHLLDGTDYTATNGSDVVLTVGAAVSDVVEVISYETFAVLDQTFTGTTTVTDSGAAPLVANRTTSDGNILDLQKDGSTVGGIRSISGDSIGVGNGNAGLRFISATNRIQPVNMSNGLNSDGLTDLGDTNKRFQDLYLSGGVYLGGTGSANKLDDVEFGDWTPTVSSSGGGFSGTVTVHHARYRKIGRTVWVDAYLSVNVSATGSGDARINSLPFTVAGGYSPFQAVHGTLVESNGGYFANGNTYMIFIANNSIAGKPIAGTGTRKVMISGHYDAAS